ncbi:hypothetical protein HMPREF0208_02495 [Citrobacter koseri]|uniref:Uncharacterized protein n=1 Tax=Citrobacter koseri (strain ATCC BAA-895 / CDC 4225-83 / SGSC4696) TaxID=290338 RepID=A8AMK0_CITK8|nr:hypothetical protein CKO_03634 [Citrobacter koseri ATCC BAA-895]KXB43743.1 hypothetical protein HMPREF0208_02495 [Citrobacter koseri]
MASRQFFEQLHQKWSLSTSLVAIKIKSEAIHLQEILLTRHSSRGGTVCERVL